MKTRALKFYNEHEKHAIKAFLILVAVASASFYGIFSMQGNVGFVNIFLACWSGFIVSCVTACLFLVWLMPALIEDTNNEI